MKMPKKFTWGYDDVTDRGKIFFNENFLSGTEKYGKLWTAITSSKIDIFWCGFFLFESRNPALSNKRIKMVGYEGGGSAPFVCEGDLT